MDAATIYAEDPAAQARAWAEAGFSWLHVVDLDGAVAGESRNGTAVRAILRSVTIPVQLGGGIRTMAAIEAWLEAGVARVILGSAAAKDPRSCARPAAGSPGGSCSGSTRGTAWSRPRAGRRPPPSLRSTSRAYGDAGAAAIVFTDIGRDGMLTGLNLAATEAIARAVPIPVIASGGAASVEDVRAVRASDAPIAGIILGRALYDGRITPAEALAAAA